MEDCVCFDNVVESDREMKKKEERDKQKAYKNSDLSPVTVPIHEEVTDGRVIRAGVSMTYDLEVMSLNPVGLNLGCEVLLS